MTGIERTAKNFAVTRGTPVEGSLHVAAASSGTAADSSSEREPGTGSVDDAVNDAADGDVVAGISVPEGVTRDEFADAVVAIASKYYERGKEEASSECSCHAHDDSSGPDPDPAFQRSQSQSQSRGVNRAAYPLPESDSYRNRDDATEGVATTGFAARERLRKEREAYSDRREHE